MTYEEKMLDCCQNLLYELAEQKAYQLAQKEVRSLQKIKRDSNMMQTGEDSGLDNLWDEICVQVQDEYSVYWDFYEDYVISDITNLIDETCTKPECQLLWLQSEDFENWSCDCLNEEDKFNNNLPYSTCDAAQYVFSKVLSIAGDYSNARIRHFIYEE